MGAQNRIVARVVAGLPSLYPVPASLLVARIVELDDAGGVPSRPFLRRRFDLTAHNGVPAPPAALAALHPSHSRLPATHELCCQSTLVLSGTSDVDTARHAPTVCAQWPTTPPSDPHATQLLPTATRRARSPVLAPKSPERHATRSCRHSSSTGDANDAPRAGRFSAAHGSRSSTVRTAVCTEE